MLDLMKVQKSLFTLLQSMLEGKNLYRLLCNCCSMIVYYIVLLILLLGVEMNDPTAQKMANMFIEDAQAVEVRMCRAMNII